MGVPWLIWRSRFGFWVAVCPDEPVGEFDCPTYHFAFTRERMIRKLTRLSTPKVRDEERVWLP